MDSTTPHFTAGRRPSPGSHLGALPQATRDASLAWLTWRAASKGAAFTLYLLFSLAPMLMLLVGLAGLLFDEEAVRSALLALLVLMSLAINAGLAALQGGSIDPSDPGKLLQYAFALLTTLIVTAIFAVISKFLPATRIAWADVLVGAVLTALLFMAETMIGLYLGHGNFSNTYGAVGSIVALIP